MSPSASKRGARGRLTTLLEVLLLSWVAGWYGGQEAQGLMVMALILGGLSLASPRLLPGTARAVIWATLGVVFVALAANVSRVTPPEGVARISGAYPYDRVVTVLFALGLTALFFRPSRATVSVTIVAVLPMMMLLLTRARTTTFGAVWREPSLWGTLFLAALLLQVERWSAARALGGPGGAVRELIVRFVMALCIVGLALPLTPLLEKRAEALRSRLTGVLHPRFHAPGRGRRNRLSLRPPEAGWGDKVRVLMAIGGTSAPPGYLRESVFVRYLHGMWHADTIEIGPLNLAELPEEDATFGAAYLLPATEGDARVETLTRLDYRVFDRRFTAGFCLPGDARVLRVADLEPRLDRNGVVRVEEDRLLPSIYAVDLPDGPRSLSAPNVPDEAPRVEYLQVPSTLTNAVNVWVATCPGVNGATNALTAGEAIARHFASRFRYSLENVSPEAGENRIEAFMRLRRGHCTLFASATVMMLRRLGFPARVVGGFVCHEQHLYGGRYVVRERDAHAWTEVWDARQKRWHALETTPPAGVPIAWSRPGKLRLAFEWFDMGRRQLVDLLQRADIVTLLALAGLWFFDSARTHPFTLLSILAALALAGWWWRRRRRRNPLPRSEEWRLRQQLAQTMQRHVRRVVPGSLRRQEAESWSEWIRRVRTDLPGDLGEELAQLVDEYESLRYGREIRGEAVRPWRERCELIRRRRTGRSPGRRH